MEINANTFRKMSFVVLAIVFFSVFIVYVITYMTQNKTSAVPLFFWIVENHMDISVTLILLSVTVGYFSSKITCKQLDQTKDNSQKLLEMLFVFLNEEEKEIISHLVENKGAVGQADISRLPGMTRVKAFRSLKRMQEKNLINIVAHGKIRKIFLKKNILKMITGDSSC